jgi:ABC-type branched-subunit amino acid transport system ATPase component
MPTRVRTEQVTVRFGSLVALSDVDLHLEKGELMGLIGPNGAGKTTMVNVLSGFQRPSEGKVVLDDADEVTNLGPESLARRGLTRTFQSTRVFARMTVFENVEAGGVGCGVRRRKAGAKASELIEAMGFANQASALASTLSQGHRRMVGLMRALATEPDLLLLDEPAAGLDEGESRDLVDVIRRVRDQFGCGIMIIEHDMRVIMPLCERIHVLNYGETIAEGAPEMIRRDPQVMAAYLGSA